MPTSAASIPQGFVAFGAERGDASFEEDTMSELPRRPPMSRAHVARPGAGVARDSLYSGTRRSPRECTAIPRVKEVRMNRREFFKCSGACAGAGAAAAALAGTAAARQAAPPQPAAQAVPADAQTPRPVRPRCAFTIDIVEGTCPPHQAGQTFKYPDEKGKICPWLMDSMNGAIRVLEYGGTMPWLYEGTPYRKVIDPNGLTTEFIRCPDPSRVVVAKISRRKV
jgi:uncharacterized repeat protein (TIGR04076 family)